MGAKSQSWVASLFGDSPQGCSLAPIFRDLSQSEKRPEIKPPLMITVSAISKNLYMYLDKRSKVDI